MSTPAEQPEPLTWEEQMAAAAYERGDIADGDSWMRVKADVDKAPPLTPGQIAKLRVLFAPEVARWMAEHKDEHEAA